MPTRKNLDEKTESTKSNYIKYFGAKEEQILRKVLAGATNKAIAEDMGLTENRVSFIVNSPIFQARQTSKQEIINKKFDDNLATDPIKKIFHDGAKEAAENIVRLSKEAQSEKLQAKTSNDVLGYDGYTQKSQEDDHSTKIFVDKSTSKHIHVAVKALNIDAELLKELNVEGVVEDIEPAGGDKSESTGSTGKKELLDILQGDNAE